MAMELHFAVCDQYLYLMLETAGSENMDTGSFDFAIQERTNLSRHLNL
jgi:hypothetical protein